MTQPLTFTAKTVQWTLVEPLVIARGVQSTVNVVLVTLQDAAGHIGRAEAAGIDYAGESTSSMLRQLDAVAHRLADETTPADIQTWLPPGGARNALDCALWDLQAKRTGVPAWQRAGLAGWHATLSAMTINLRTATTTR